MTFAELKILAQKHGRNLGNMARGKQSKRALTAVLVLFALPVFGVLTAFGVASDSQLDKVPRREMIELLAMPASEESMLVEKPSAISRKRPGAAWRHGRRAAAKIAR